MGDTRLRGLEARFRESGTVEDEAAWLRERCRHSGLSKNLLNLIAFCEYEAVFLAFPELRGASWSCLGFSWLDPSLEGISEIRQRITIAVGSELLMLVRQTVSEADILQSPWLEACHRFMHQQVNDMEGQPFLDIDHDERFERVIRQQRNACMALIQASELVCAEFASREPTQELLFQGCLAAARAATSMDFIREAIVQHVLPWALGYKDPLVDLIARLQK